MVMIANFSPSAMTDDGPDVLITAETRDGEVRLPYVLRLTGQYAEVARGARDRGVDVAVGYWIGIHSASKQVFTEVSSVEPSDQIGQQPGTGRRRRLV